MNLSVTKRFTFEAAHHLPRHLGKCHRPHGHSYILYVTVYGPVVEDAASDQGMVMDFTDLKAVVKPIIERFDHYDLNQYMKNPTAENVLQVIVDDLSDRIERPRRLLKVVLYETEDSFVAWDAQMEKHQDDV